jgi:hypothetical protein
MSPVNKSKSHRPGAESKRRKMADSHESKVEREQELSAGQRTDSAAASAPTSEEPPAPKRDASPWPADDHERRVRTMDDKENASSTLFEGLSEATSTLFSPESARKIAALWLDSGEKVANQALEFQAKATEWSKNTIFAPIFEIQNSIARDYVELSAKTARRFWQLE